jgi:FkbM family methyltransferase
MRLIRRAIRRAMTRRGLTLTRTPAALLETPSAVLQFSFDHVLSHFLLHCSTPPTFIQIGAFDGKSGDPIYPYIKRGLLKGCFVEPQADAFQNLQANYAGVEGVRFKRAAIGPKSGEATLYRVKPGTPGPEWLFQIASFSRDVLMKHAPYAPGLEQAIITETVPTVTFDELLAELPEPPSVVVIDTEGYDYEIVKLLDVPRRKPSLILYEHKHLSDADQNACVKLLIDAGYLVAPIGQDTVASQPESGTNV